MIPGCRFQAPHPPRIWYGPPGCPLKIDDFNGIPCSGAMWAHMAPISTHMDPI